MHIIQGLSQILHVKKGCGLAEVLTLQRSVAKNRPHTVLNKAQRY